MPWFVVVISQGITYFFKRSLSELVSSLMLKAVYFIVCFRDLERFMA